MDTVALGRIRHSLYLAIVLMTVAVLLMLAACAKREEAPPVPAPAADVEAPAAPRPPSDSEPATSGREPASVDAGIEGKSAALAPEAGLSWNVWIENDGTVQKAIRPGTTADIVLDLSKYVYDGTSAIAAGPELRKYIKDEAKRPETRIIVRAGLLGAGDRVAFDFEAKPQQSIKLDLTRLSRSDESEFAAAKEALGATNIGQPSLSEKYGLGRFRVPITVKPGAPDCFQVAFTIWDRQDARPLDHIVLTAATVERDKPANCGLPRLQGGFGAMAGALSSAGTTKAAASLYIFEYTDTAQALQTRAVFADVQGSSPSNIGPTMYSWSIPGVLTSYLNGKDLEAAIHAARYKEDTSGRYVELANELKSKFFPFDRYDDKHNAESAFSKIANLSGNAGERPIVLVRYLSAQGKHVYAPLSILNASASVKRKFQVSYPLPREDYGVGRCIGEYSFAYPQKLSGRQSKLELDGVALPKDRFRRLENDEELRCYLNFEGEGCKPDSPAMSSRPGEAFLLLAHQSNGLLWYTDDGVLKRIVIDDERRSFPPGSAAFLSACSVLNSGENADRLVIRLNEYGVDAIVASPFPVDINYGVLLSENLVKVMSEAYAKKETLSVYQIFQRAVDKIRSVPASQKKYGEMDFEFLVLGNGQIRMCR